MPASRPRSARFLYVVLVAFALLVPVSLVAQDAPPAQAGSSDTSGRVRPPRIYDSMRLEGPAPKIDGKIDDAAWRLGEWASDYTQQIPTEGAPPSAKTELKILYDDKNVYFAVKAYDDPALIHRYPGRRDELTGDIVGVCFDSYFDKRSGFEFDLTAAGTKMDLVLTNEGWDLSWDAVWYGKVGMEPDGWVAEFQVPFSQLRYGTQEEQVWGLHAWRWIDRNQEESQFNLIPRNSTGRMQNIGELHGIRNLPRYRHIELLPHTVGKLDALPREVGNPYRDGPSGHGAVGLDAKLGVTSDFTLDLTVNPDFGQVEADPSVVNLTAYETFFEEKRPFFMEGKNILTLNLDSVATAGDVALSFGTNEMMFYSRRIGQAPHAVPGTRPGEFLEMPDHTSILTAAKVTGKTPAGLSLGIVQSVTGRERARLSFDGIERREAVEPTTNYFASRVQKDWDKGNTVLGGMLTDTHRFTKDPALASMTGDALTGAIDFVQFFKSRSYVLEAKGAFSHITGDAPSIRALAESPVHYYQRPDADHLGVDQNATSLDGWAGTVRFARYGNSKFRWSNQVRWASPGFDLNDIGFLRQADFVTNAASAGYFQSDPEGPFRQWTATVERDDSFDYSGMRTEGSTSGGFSGTFNNKWAFSASLFALEGPTDTRLLRGGPSMRTSGFYGTFASLHTDPSRRVNGAMAIHRHFGADAGTRESEVEGSLRWRASQRLALQSVIAYSQNLDDLQYVDTITAAAAPRYLLGRIDQDTFGVTFRADLQLTPDLTVQYYGSPFVSTGRYTSLKRVTNPRSSSYTDRFHRFTPGEIAFDADANRYLVAESGGPAYSFANPDFSFREFRSNLVTRWEFTPGSTMYVVWSQGRTSVLDRWDSSVGHSFNRLWDTPAANVFLVKFSYWLAM